MENVKNMTFDGLAVVALSSGIKMISDAGEKWYIGLILVGVGASLSYAKYKLRSISSE